MQFNILLFNFLQFIAIFYFQINKNIVLFDWVYLDLFCLLKSHMSFLYIYFLMIFLLYETCVQAKPTERTKKIPNNFI